MSNLGISRNCEGLITFRVDPRIIPSGTRLRRYYMHRYAQLIDQMQPLIEAGSAALAQYLTTSEWQKMDLRDQTAGLESDLTKMMVVLEATFEHTRKMFAPCLRSRLDCVFVWPTLEFANEFRAQYIPAGVIHRCRVLHGQAVELDGSLLPPGIDLSDLSPEVFSAEFQAAQLRARKYWTAKESPDLPELLVVGDVEVVGVESEG